MQLIDRWLYATTVALVMLVVGLRSGPAINLEYQGGTTADGAMPAYEGGLAAQMESAVGDQIVLRAISEMGITPQKLETVAKQLRARLDILDVETNLDLPKWEGDPDLAGEWDSLWRDRAVGLLEIHPDLQKLKRNPEALRKWADEILASAPLAEGHLSDAALKTLTIAETYETQTRGMMKHLWKFALAASLYAWLLTLFRRFRVSGTLSGTKSSRWLVGLGVESLVSIMTLILLCKIFFSAPGSPLAAGLFSASACLIWIAGYGVVVIADWRALRRGWAVMAPSGGSAEAPGEGSEEPER